MDMDTAWKHLFALPAMVEHLLRAVAPSLAERLDFATLRRISANWTTSGAQRYGDAAWRVDYADESERSLVLLLEFQSSVDRNMPTRVRRYQSMAENDLRRERQLDADGKLRILSVVVYSGRETWPALGVAENIGVSDDGELLLPAGSAHLLLDARRPRREHSCCRNPTMAVLGLEGAGSLGELAERLRSLAAWLPEALDEETVRELRQAIRAWLSPTLRRLFPDADEGAVAKMERELLAEESEEMTTLLQRVEEWEAEFRQEGVEEGLRRGVEQGLAAERALLRQQATRKFGAATGEEFGRRLATVSDAEHLAKAGGWIIDCATGGELLDRFDLP